MGNEKSDFISYIDDDGTQKDRWVDIIEENSTYVRFRYQGEVITIPWHRINKVKRRGMESED